MADDKSTQVTAQKASEDQPNTTDDSLTFSNEVIEKIVATAAMSVEGVAGMRQGFVNRVKETFTGAGSTGGVEIEVNDDGSVVLHISVVMAYGAYAPDVFEGVKKAVVSELKRMCALEVSAVNLRIADVLAPGEETHTSAE